MLGCNLHTIKFIFIVCFLLRKVNKNKGLEFCQNPEWGVCEVLPLTMVSLEDPLPCSRPSSAPACPVSLVLTVGQHHTTAARSASRVESPLIHFIKRHTCTFGMQPELGEAIHANVLRTFYSQPQGGSVRTQLRGSAVKTGLALISLPPVCSWVPRSWPSAIPMLCHFQQSCVSLWAGSAQRPRVTPRPLQPAPGIQGHRSARTRRTRGDGSAPSSPLLQQ